ncbi:MAG TPA: hypothetical protein VMT58_07465, partial [Candidatus Binataceae bacterium]|nr:hypothetical protein [Candidatus Binataceae bacterium]
MAADANKSAFGFQGKLAYQDAADQGKLLVAAVSEHSERKYAGHLWFGGVFPLARIFQTFVSPPYRR